MVNARMAVVAVLSIAAIVVAPSATADVSRIHVGDYGQRVSVSQTKDLDSQGQRIVIRGKKFDPRVGVYVALCVIPDPGQQPTPCGGGVDMQGASGSSTWVSSNPPPYARSLVVPFSKNGNFRTAITVSSRIGDVDCREVRCALTIRADHLRSRDRSHDVFVPVTFQ